VEPEISAPILPEQAAVCAPVSALRRFLWWAPVFITAWLAILLTAFPNPVGLVRQNWPLIFVGFAGAVIGNATAVGGGLVFIPVAIFVYHFAPVTALKLALGTQAVGMSSGAFAWARRGAVPHKVLWASVPALLLGSLTSTFLIRPNALLVKGVFGPVSILIGILMLGTLDRRGEFDELPARAWAPLVIVAYLGGCLTGWVAVGEGEVVAAFLMVAYGLRAQRGIGLGVSLLAINSIFLVLLHQVFLGGVPWDLIMFTGLGCVFGAKLGPLLGHWVGTRRLKLGFAVVAIADGILFVAQYLR
jgi:uncharacterized membrane protein YfcA